MSNWKVLEFESIANLSKQKFNPRKEKTPQICIELEHISKNTGYLLSTTTSNLQLSTKNIFSKGDVLFGKLRPNLRKYIYCNFAGVCSAEIWVLIAQKNIYSKFLFYLVQQESFISSACIVIGSKMPRADWNYVSKIPFPIPPLPEQKAIASLLQQWDAAIEKTDALIAAKKHQFKWLRSSLIGNSKIITPNRLGNLLSESRIIDKRNDPRRRITVRLHLKGVKIRKYRGNEIEGATQHFVRKKGQLIYGKQNISRGAIGIIPETLDGYSSSQDIPAFDIADNVCSDWLFWYMSRPSFYEKLAYFTTGSGSKRLHPSDLFKVAIGLPSTSEQQRIAKILNTNHREIELLQKQAQQYRSQKHGLMQKLLTGEWRIRKWQTNH